MSTLDLTVTGRHRGTPTTEPAASQHLAERIGLLLNGSPWTWWDDHDHRWQIGQGNNAWLRPLDENRYRLSCRYASPAQMTALGVVLAWRLPVTPSSPGG